MCHYPSIQAIISLSINAGREPRVIAEVLPFQDGVKESFTPAGLSSRAGGENKNSQPSTLTS